MLLNKSRLAHGVAALGPLWILAGCGGGESSGSPQSTTAATVIAQTPNDMQLPDEEHLPPNAEQANVTPSTEGLVASVPQPDMPVDGTWAETPTPVASEHIRLAAAYTPLVAGTIKAAPYWPVWYGTGKPVDGVGCLVSGSYHRHALISIYKDGKRLGFADGIGRVHAGCYHAYEMHTHDVTGIVHMEADVPKQFKLGQWFSLWKQPLSRTNVAGLAGPARFYIIENGRIQPYAGDPYQIQMLPHREVLIVTGTPMSVVPKYQWPTGI